VSVIIIGIFAIIVYKFTCSARIRLPAALLLLLSAAVAGYGEPASGQAAAGSQSAHTALKLRNLSITVCDVFDTAEAFSSHPAARLLNVLHINTRTPVVARELLFLRDSVITEQRVNESAKNLRSLGIFQSVSIDLHPAGGSRADAAVFVQDQFSTDIDISLRRESGTLRGALGLRESNFLGRGYFLNVNRSNKEIRRKTEFQFQNSRFFGSRFKNLMKYVKYDEGEHVDLGLNKLFFSQETRWDSGIRYTKFTGMQNLYQQDGSLASEHDSRRLVSFWRAYFSSPVRMRLGIKCLYSDERWSDLRAPGKSTVWDSRAVMVWFGAIRRRLDVVYNIDKSDVEEDMHTGFLVNAGAGADVPASGATHAHRLFSLRAVFGSAVSRHENIFMEITDQRALSGGHVFERVANARLAGFTTRFPYQTIAVHVEYNEYNTPRPFQQAYLGENQGLRGYADRAFLGSRRILVNCEDRIMTNLRFFLFRFGGVVFFDAGKVWEPGQSFTGAPWHSSAGFGLRVSFPKARKAVFRIDFSYNMDSRKFATVAFSSGHYFRVLYPIEIGVLNFKPAVAY